MKQCLLIFCLFAFGHAYSQKTYDHELQLTETKFALESQIHGLKWGFLHNMDTEALGIGREGYMNLYESWKGRPENAGFVLLWKPAIIFWSDDGLFGITSGPFYSKGPTDSILPQNGNFFTIWKRDNVSAPYKFVLDIGVNLSGPSPANLTRDADVPRYPIPSKPGKWMDISAPLIAYQKLAQTSLKDAVKTYANDQSCILVAGYGMVQRSALDKAATLAGKAGFDRMGWKLLNESCYYEWGTLRSGSSKTNNPAYFIHVWSVQNEKPVLVAAVYRIE